MLSMVVSVSIVVVAPIASIGVVAMVVVVVVSAMLVSIASMLVESRTSTAILEATHLLGWPSIMLFKGMLPLPVLSLLLFAL